MSTQSILIKNLSSYQDEFDDKMVRLGDDYLIYKRFMIGTKPDHKRMMFVKSFNDLLCTDNCELIGWIDKKIKGKLEDRKIRHKKKPTISDLFKLYQQQVENCSITEVTESCCDWEEIGW